MSDAASLTVPGFNGGRPIRLIDFAVTPGLRAAGGGRSGRIADWAGRFDVENETLARDLTDHLERTFEEGHTGICEIVAGAAGAGSKFEGVAVRHRGGVKFAFEAFARNAV